MELVACMEDCAKRIQMPADHVAYLRGLKERGVEPRVIYDIGAAVLHWTRIAHELWPEARIYVFDAFEPLEYMYLNTPYEYHIGVLGDKDDAVVKFYENLKLFGGNSYYKECNDTVFPPDKYVMKRMQRLDTVVASRGFPPPDLVKIDVQGAEKDILVGGQKTLAHAAHLIVEMQHTEYNVGAPKAAETLPFLESFGWTCCAPLFCNNGPDGDYHFVRTGVATGVRGLSEKTD